MAEEETTVPYINVMSSNTISIAIIGGGITGATAAQALAHQHNNCKNNNKLTIHVFDQGRRGVGGRTSSRTSTTSDGTQQLKFDHGCQFFRGDTPQFQSILKTWIQKDYVREWKGNFQSSNGMSSDREFFGLPSTPPFYVAVNGMQSLAKNVLDQVISSASNDNKFTELQVFSGTRVDQLERDTSSNKWKLHGTSGVAAYHDTPEKIAQSNNTTSIIGQESGYDAIILSDVSSSFGKWHRASAGVPESFAKRVRERVGARVPLFSCMIAFDKDTNIPFDAASFDDSIVWFAAKSNSKPGMEALHKECWTIVSTPEYAMAKIEETPMQDAITGEFIPQSADYLTTVPGPDLYNAFKVLIGKETTLDIETLPKIVFMDAQRWGSAMPAHRHVDINSSSSSTCRKISGVNYDCGRHSLAPTKEEGGSEDEKKKRSFLVDDDLMLLQAGDMMGKHTPGFESAVISGIDAAEYLYDKLSSDSTR